MRFLAIDGARFLAIDGASPAGEKRKEWELNNRNILDLVGILSRC